MTPFMEKRLSEITYLASGYDSRSAFKSDNPDMYKWLLKYGLVKRALPKTTRDGKWCRESVIDAARLCETRSEFHEKHSAAYAWARKNYILHEVHEIIPTKRRRISRDEAENDAKKCTNRTEFYSRFCRSYTWCARNGILDDVCAHMSSPLTHWTVEDVSKLAVGFETRKDFERNHPNAYRWAIMTGVSDIVFSHMEYASTASDYDCLYMWSPVGHDNVFKVGVTSTRLGVSRIHEVASRGGFDVGTVIAFRVKDARRIESEILAIGDKYDVGRKFNGSTEFRYYGPKDLDSCFLRLSECERLELAA